MLSLAELNWSERTMALSFLFGNLSANDLRQSGREKATIDVHVAIIGDLNQPVADIPK